MRAFLVASALLASACARSGSRGQGGVPGMSEPPDCGELEGAAAASREVGGPDAAEAVFALAECEHARFAAGAEGRDADARVPAIVALYDEAAKLAPGKWPIGAAVRKGDLYRVSAGRGTPDADVQARQAYEAGLAEADDAAVEVRMDIEVAGWIRSACRAVGEAEGRRQHLVCKPWGGAWR